MRTLQILSLALLAPFGAAPAAAATLSPSQRACVDGLSRSLDEVERQVVRQLDRCLKRHAAGKPFDKKDPSLDTLEACAAADRRGRIARAAAATQKHFDERCSPPPLGRLEDPFPEFGATDAARVNGAARAFAPDLAHALFGPDLDATLAVERDAAKCQQAVWKAATRCHRARSAAFRSCQKQALAGGRGAPGSAAREELRGACLGEGAEPQPDPRGRLAAKCSAPGKGIARALAKACGGLDPGALLPGCAGEPDIAACLDRRVACRACRELSAAGDLRRSCDLFDDGEANGSCGATALQCASPADGGMLVALPGSEIEFVGQVPDPSQIEGVAVDGVPVELDAEGFFSHPVAAEYGIHFLELAAQGETGVPARRVCSFLASESFEAEYGFLGDALSLTLGQSALDDGSRSGDLNSLADVLDSAVNSQGLRNQIHAELLAANPLHSECYVHNPLTGACLASVTLTYTGSSFAGPNSVELDLLPGEIRTQMTARNLSIGIRAAGVAPFQYSVSGTLSSSSLVARFDSEVVVANGTFDSSMNDLQVSVGALAIDLDGAPDFVDGALGLVLGLVTGSIEEILADFATQALAGGLGELLSSLALANDLDVPRLAAPGVVALSLETEASSASASAARALLGLSVRATAPAAHDLPSLGVARPSGAVLGDPGTATPLALAAHLGALNQILHALWRGGLLHGHVDESVLPELGPGVVAELEPLLPPVVSSADGETGIVQLGALRMTLVHPGVFDAPVRLTAGAEAQLTLATDGDALRLDDLTLVSLRVSGVETALTPADQVFVDVAATLIFQRALEAALAAAAEGLSIPSFDAAAFEEYGIPAGTRLGFVEPALDSTPSHLQLRSSFGVVD